MEKSPEAFRTISEVADFLETPAHVLRFWESRFPQIRPVKRAGGRRYYRPGDVALLAGIKKLLHDEGMTIRGVQKILREHGIRHVAGLAEGFGGDAVEGMLDPAAAAALFRSDIADDDGEQGTDEAHSAQIISLEVALGRAEQIPPAEGRPWPQDPGDLADATTEATLWPTDAQDEGPDPASAEAAASAPEIGAEMGRSEDAHPDGPGSTDDDGDAALRDEEPIPSADAEASSDDPEMAEGDAAGLPAPNGDVDSESTEGPPSAEPAIAVEPTVAALLRQRSEVQVAAVQPDLIRLRDRLADLRNRVAEAARRRAR